jgi:hypothetical protein
MNRFNLDPVFTLNVRPNDKAYISNLITVDSLEKIETQLSNMLEYKDASELLKRFMKNV